MAQSTDGGSKVRVNFLDDADKIEELERTKARAEVVGVRETGITMSEIYREAVRLEIKRLRKEIDKQS
jgi:hypothetical protein